MTKYRDPRFISIQEMNKLIDKMKKSSVEIVFAAWLMMDKADGRKRMILKNIRDMSSKILSELHRLQALLDEVKVREA
jgi:hypothetical protein